MDTQRLVNIACQQGMVSQRELKRAQDEHRDRENKGIAIDPWEVLQDLSIITSQQAKEVEASVATGAYRGLEVDGYAIQSRIGSGGMGDVYLADRIHGDSDQVAIKLLPRRLCSDPEHLARFKWETNALADLSHENITGFIGSGTVDSRPFLIMELVRGLSIKEHLRERGALRQREALHLMRQISSAMMLAQSHGMVHRDIKPANIILGPARSEHEPFCAKLCDFGLVKFLSERASDLGADQQLTVSGIALGTPHYMSPEQATGENDIDQRSDLYSFGATVYHALMGRTLFSGKTSALIMYKQVTAAIDVEPLRDRGCGSEIIELLRDMLRKDRDERPESWQIVSERAGAILSSLDTTDSERLAIAEGRPLSAAPNAAQGPAAAMPTPVYQQRRRGLLMIGLVAVMLVAGLVAALIALAPAGGGGALRADPETIDQVWEVALDRSRNLVASVRAHGGDPAPLVIRLERGVYRGNWSFPTDTGSVDIRAESPGVVFISEDNTPVFSLADGVSAVRLVDLTLRSDGGRILRVGPGAQLSVERCRIEGQGAIRVDGGSLALLGGSAKAQVLAGPQSNITLSDVSLAASAPLVQSDAATVTIERSRLAVSPAERPDPGLLLRGGSLRVNAVILEAPRMPLALRISGSHWADLQDLQVSGPAIGIDIADSQLPVFRRISVEAADTALQWRGRWEPDWRWESLQLQAATPVDGLRDIPLDGPGADPAALSAVP